MTVIGSASVDIRANDKFFERDVRKIVKGLKDVTLNIKADVDLTKVNKKLRDLRYRQGNKDIVFNADVNTSRLDKKMEKMWNSYDGQSIDVGFSQTGLDKIESQLKDLKSLGNKKVKLSVEIDDDEIQGALDRADALIDVTVATTETQAALEEVSRDRHTNIYANADTAGAEAQLGYAARNRSSIIRASIDPQTMAGIKGFFYTLTGAIPADRIKSVLVGMTANFEALSVKAGLAATGVMGLGASLTHLVGDALTISGDLTQTVGILAAMPAAIGLGATSIATLAMGWKDFGKALTSTGKEQKEALKNLPEEAKAAVKGLDGMGSKIREVTQAQYWEGLKTSVQDAARAMEGPLLQGFSAAGRAMGLQTKALMDTFKDFANSGGLATTFNNINSSIERGAKAVSGFSKGFLALMEGGSKSLPKFGTWMGDLGTKFSKWATEANDSGQITVWIDTATQRLKELGSIVKSTSGIFSGLTNAARNVGMNGLPELAGGLQKVSDIVNGPKFQAGMTDIFLSSRRAIENMGPGIRDFFDMVAKGTPKIGQAMEISGETVGQAFKNVSAMFDGTGLGAGFIEMLGGVRDAMEILEPGFGSLGSALGGLMRVAGEVVKSMAPGLNQLFDTLDGVINGMADGMIAAMPVFNEFMQAILSVLKAVVIPMAQGLGKLLEAFSALPGPIQTVIMSLAAMLLLKKKFGDFFGGIRDGLRSTVGEMATSMPSVAANTAKSLAGSNKVVFGALRESSKAINAQDAQMRKLLATNTLNNLKSNSKAEMSVIRAGQREQIASAKQTYRDRIAYAKDYNRQVKQLAKENGGPVSGLKNIASVRTAAQQEYQAAVGGARRVSEGLRAEYKQRITDANNYVKSLKRNPNDISQAASLGSINRSLANTASTIKPIQPKIDPTYLQDGVRRAENFVFQSTSRMSQAMSKGLSNATVSTNFTSGIQGAMYKAQAAVTAGSGNIKKTMATTGQAAGKALSTGIQSGASNIKLSPMQASIVGAMNGIKSSVNGAKTTLVTAASSIKSAWSGVGAAMSTGVASGMGPIKSAATGISTAATRSAKAIGVAGKSGLSAAATGLMGVLGGPWGIALTAGVAGIAAIGQASADAKQQVEDLKNTMSSSGGATAETKNWMMQDIQKDKGDIWDKGNSFLSGKGSEGADVQKQFESIGTSLSKVTDKMVSGGSEASDTWIKFKDDLGLVGASISNLDGKAFLKEFNVSNDQLKSIGIKREEFEKLDRVGLSNVIGKMGDLSAKTKEAQKSASELQQSYTELASAQLASNKTALEDISSSIDAKMAAFKSNQQILGLEQLTGQSGAYDLGITSEKNNQALKTLQSTAKQTGIALKDTFSVEDMAGKSVTMFRMNTEAGRQMYDVMRTQADGIHKATISTYDQVLKSTGDLGQAQSAAFKVANDEVQKFTQQLSSAGLKDADIRNLLDTAGLSPEDIEIAIKTKGSDEAIAEAQRVQAAMQAFTQDDYTALFNVKGMEETKSKVADLLNISQDFTNTEFTTRIRANFENEGEYQQWRSEFTAATPEQRYKMIAELVGGEEALSRINEVLGKGKELNSTKFKSMIDTIVKNTGQTPEEVSAALNKIPKETIAKIVAESGGDEKKIIEGIKSYAQNNKVELPVEVKQPTSDPLEFLRGSGGLLGGGAPLRVGVQADVTGKEQVDGLRTTLTSFPDSFITSLVAHANTTQADAFKGVVESLPAEKQTQLIAAVMSGNVAGYTSLLSSVPTEKTTNLTTVANTAGATALSGAVAGLPTEKVTNLATNADTSGVSTVSNAVAGLPVEKVTQIKTEVNSSPLDILRNTFSMFPEQKTVSLSVNADQGGLNTIKSAMDSISDKSVKVNVSANSGALSSLKSAMDSVRDKSVKVNVSANAGALNGLKSAMNAVQNKSVKVNVAANAGPIKNVQSALNGVKNKSVSVAVTANTGPVSSMRNAINAIKAKTVDIKANAGAAMSAISKVNGAKIAAKTLTINGNAGPALSAIARVNGAHVANKSSTITITTIRRTVTQGENANGGMYMRGVQTFANGGKMDPRALRAMRSFKGGSENHRAQISKSATQFRIWGEPETGGEAYIPLAASKRSRSLKILEQVAQHFGMSLSQQFADGGFMSGMSLGSGITSYASGGTTKKTKSSSSATKAQKKAEAERKKADKKAEDKKKEAQKKAKELNDKLSKSMSELRKSISDNSRDIRKVFGAEEASPVQKALGSMGGQLRSFASTYSKSKPKEAKNAQNALKKVDAQYKLSKAWNKSYTKIEKVNGKNRRVTRKYTSDQIARQMGQDAIRRQKSKAPDFNSKFTLRDYEVALSRISNQLDTAKSRLDNINSASKSLRTGTAGSLFKSYDLGSLQGKQDIFGNTVAVSAKDISDYTKKRLSDMQKLNSYVDKMKSMGYNKAFIADLANMGLDDALEYAKALTSTKSYVNQINSGYKDMFGVGGQYNLDADNNTSIGGLANYIGYKLSENLYRSGQNAANGLVKGLTAEKRAVEIAGQKLADSLAAAVKKALKIKSPSRVMMGIGKFVPQGLALGIQSEKSLVDKSMSNLVDTSRVDLSVPTRSRMEFQNSGQSGIIRGNAPIEIHQTINPSQGLSEEQIGKSATNNMLFRLGTLA